MESLQAKSWASWSLSFLGGCKILSSPSFSFHNLSSWNCWKPYFKYGTGLLFAMFEILPVLDVVTAWFEGMRFVGEGKWDRGDFWYFFWCEKWISSRHCENVSRDFLAVSSWCTEHRARVRLVLGCVVPRTESNTELSTDARWKNDLFKEWGPRGSKIGITSFIFTLSVLFYVNCIV